MSAAPRPVRIVACQQCRKPTATKFSAVLCAKCDELNRRTRCAGCFKVIAPAAMDGIDAAADESKHCWHTSCFRVFHPDSLVVTEDANDALPVASRHIGAAVSSPSRSTLVTSAAEVAAAAPGRRRKSLWRLLQSQYKGLAAALSEQDTGHATVAEDARASPAPASPVPVVAAMHQPGSSPTSRKAKRKAAVQAKAQLGSSSPFYCRTFEGLVARLKAMGLVRERVFKMNTFADCIVAREVVDFLIRSKQCGTRQEAVVLGSQLLARRFLLPTFVEDAPMFLDDLNVFIVVAGEPGLIHPPAVVDRGQHDAADVLEPGVRTFASAVLQEQYFIEPRGRVGSGQPFAVSSASSDAAAAKSDTGSFAPVPSASGLPVPALGQQRPSISSDAIRSLVSLVGQLQLSVEQQREQFEAKNFKAGFMLKQGHRVRNWKRRWFILRGHTLLYYKKPGDTDAAGTVDIADYFLDESLKPSHPLRMRLSSKRTPGLEYVIEAETAKDFVEWVKALDGVMKDWEKLVTAPTR